MTYIVTKDNTYYPSVAYFDDRDAARKQRDEWLEDMRSDGEKYTCKVCIAKILEEDECKSDY